jgi:hypothetical protein
VSAIGSKRLPLAHTVTKPDLPSQQAPRLAELPSRKEQIMPVAVIQDFEGATLDQYDKIIEQMGITPGGKHSDPGCLFHWVTKTDDGLKVVDVWETRDQFDKFITAQVVPRSLEAGFPNPPQTTIHEVHTYFH